MRHLMASVSIIGFQLVNGDSLDQIPDKELLRIVLKFCDNKVNAFALANILLAEFGSLGAIANAPAARLLKIDGMTVRLTGFIKFLHLLETRSRKSINPERLRISDYTQLHDFLSSRWSYLETEEMHVFFLDNGYRLVKDEVIARGSIDNVYVEPKLIVKRAVELHASRLIIAHNHPSGHASPTRSDLEWTSLLVAACRTLDIAVDDHVIFGNGSLYSMRKDGKLGMAIAA